MVSATKKSWLYRVPRFWLEVGSLTCSSPRSRFDGSESVFVLTGQLTCGCNCLFVIPVTSLSQSGSIMSQLVDVFTSRGNSVTNR